MSTVLVVDDEQSLLIALEYGLTDAGYRVITAETGEEALLSVRDFSPSIILLDIMMPGIGGLETLKLLRTHPNYKKLRVILMSGARPLVRQADYRWDAFLYKPFTIGELLKEIKTLV
jgi:DNA-binding response OmpR family regulator